MSLVRPFIVASLGLLVAPVFVWPVAAQPRARQTARPSAVRFEFESRGGKDGNPPHSRVFVNAQGRRTLVFSLDEEFHPMERHAFASQGVPRQALAACTGWWAGAGDNLYIVRRGTRLDVYRQEVDEEQERPLPYRKIKSIALSPRTG